MFPAGYCASLGVGGWLLMIGFWAALIAVVVWAVTRLFPSPPKADPPFGEQPADDPEPASPAELPTPRSRVGAARH